MKVLITGSAGFLGRWFVDWHLRHNIEVVGIDDLSNSAKPPRRDGYEFIEDDAAEYLSCARAPYDYAMHFAAPVGGRQKIENDPFYNADSLRLDQAFFRWAIEHTSLTVYPSSSAVYGVKYQGDKPQKLHESMFHPGALDWPQPDELYGFTKMAGEVLAYKAERYGLSTLCIRPFSGYGEGQSFEYPVPSICLRAAMRENPITVWGSGRQRRDFIHVSDLVGATMARLDAGVTGYSALNIGSGVPVTFTCIAQIAANLVGYEPEIVTDEGKPEGVSARYADISAMKVVYDPIVSLKNGLMRVLEGMPVAEDRPV